MNKYKFISKSKSKVKFKSEEKTEDIKFEEHPIFNIDTRGTSMSIIKSEIQVKLKNFFKNYLKKNSSVQYFKVNENTKLLLRNFYSHEIDYVPKNITDVDKKVGNVIGIILGIKIILDNSLADRQVLPLSLKRTVKQNKLKKMKFVFN